MSLIVAIILGALVGYIASKVMGREEGFIKSAIIGIVGSVIGSFVSRLFTGDDKAYLTFSWMGLFWSFIGAIILVALLNKFAGRSHNTAA